MFREKLLYRCTYDEFIVHDLNFKCLLFDCCWSWEIVKIQFYTVCDAYRETSCNLWPKTY